MPGLNFALLYGVLYHQVATNTEQGTTARTEAGHTAQTETFIGLLLWLAVFGVVVLLKPKWWYLAVAFAITIGGALWISTL